MIVVDIETSGTDPHKHSILSVGAIEFKDPQNQFYSECRVWEGAHIEDEALEINGFDRKDITDPHKESLDILMKSFLNWSLGCKERTLAGHNISFDVSFLKDSARRLSLNWPFAERTIDTHSLAYGHMIGRGFEPPREKDHSGINLDNIFEYVGLKIERHKHNALEDAKLTAESISRLLYSKPLFEDFKQFKVPFSS